MTGGRSAAPRGGFAELRVECKRQVKRFPQNAKLPGVVPVGKPVILQGACDNCHRETSAKQGNQMSKFAVTF